MSTVGLVMLVGAVLIGYEAVQLLRGKVGKAEAASAPQGGTGQASTSAPPSQQSIAASVAPGGRVNRYNLEQLTQMAKNAGFTGTPLQTIVAIVLRESGGVPGSQDYASSGHYGLLQFSSALRSTYGVDTSQDWNPAVAQQEFNAAYKQWVSRRGFFDWGGWTECGTAIPVPTSPSSVIQCGGSPVPLPSNFYQVVR